MALNRFEASVVSRGKGQNVVARAAYIARERLIDERTNHAFDYSHLDEPEWKGVFTPDSVPTWTSERQALWNAVERREDRSTRPDQAQLARDFKIALPHELNIEQRRALATEFAAYMAQQGMVVDMAIHQPDAHGDQRNFHVHMLCTMREVSPEGFGPKVRQWNSEVELERWKDRWSEMGSQHLREAGHGVEADRFRVGHWTLQKQRQNALERRDFEWAEALDRIPQKHMGPQAAAMERDGFQTQIGNRNREVQERNQKRGLGKTLSRTNGEIRLAFQLTDKAQAFADALEDRGLVLARVSAQDRPKLDALEKRRFEEREAEHKRKIGYLDRRIADESRAGSVEKTHELLHHRQTLQADYDAGLPWMARVGGVDKLTPEQREIAQRSYDAWYLKKRYDFPNYVSYTQGRWAENPAHRSRFKEKDMVVVNQDGEVHGLNFHNTGQHPKSLKRYLKEIDTAPFFSVTGAWEVFRAVHDHRKEEALWPERERVWPTQPKTMPGLSPSTVPVLNSAPPWWDMAASFVTADTRPLNAPQSINKPLSHRFPEQPTPAIIWESFNRNRNSPTAFAQALDAEGIALCGATKMEAAQSHNVAAFAREIGRYSPSYREDEPLAMDRSGRTHRINQRTTGANPRDIEKFLEKLDRTQLPSISEATKMMHERASAQKATAELMKLLFPLREQEFERSLGVALRGYTRAIRHAASRGLQSGMGVGRIGMRVVGMGLGALTALFAPSVTPVQRIEGQIAENERRRQAAEYSLRRRGRERER